MISINDEFATSQRAGQAGASMNSSAAARDLFDGHLLVGDLVCRIRQVVAAGESCIDVGLELGRRFASEIEPHFGIEERLVAPMLESSAARHLATRTINEHQLLRSLLVGARSGRPRVLTTFANILEAHMKFEERALYPLLTARRLKSLD